MANIEFAYDRFNEERHIDAMRQYGAVILRGFISVNELQLITDEIMTQPFTEVDHMHGSVHEQFGLQAWDMDQAPDSVVRLAGHMGNGARNQGIPWYPNAVRAQLYEPGKAGVDWHRDFKSSLLVVGVANIFGEAQFDVKVEDEEQSVVLEPGDIALLRNSVADGIDERIEHRVHPPQVGSRLSLGIRQDRR
jgi:hypothetical protein